MITDNLKVTDSQLFHLSKTSNLLVKYSGDLVLLSFNTRGIVSKVALERAAKVG